MKNIKKTKKWWSMAELGECPKKFISFARGISDYFDLGGKTLQNARNHIKAFDFGKDKLNVKKFGKPPFPNILFYSLGLRRKKAESAYYNAIEILRRGILTPKPYAYIIKKGRFFIGHSYFISEQIEGLKQLREAAMDRKAMEAFVKFTAVLHEKGILHKDYSPGNILYRKISKKERSGNDGKFSCCRIEGYEFCICDVNRIKLYSKPVPIYAGLRTLVHIYPDNELYTKQLCAAYQDLRGKGNVLMTHFVLVRLHINRLQKTAKKFLKKLPGAKAFLCSNGSH